MRKSSAKGLFQSLGGRFSSELGINLRSGEAREVFKWFLAAILFGARISETIARRTYREFAQQKLLDPRSLTRRGWDGLVGVFDKGGYARYDFKTATKLLEVSRALTDRYGGDLNQLHAAASNPRDLEERLKNLGKGIGEVTVNIFLRELRGVWRKAEPALSELAMSAARDLQLLPKRPGGKARALALLKKTWTAEGNRDADFPDFEAALVRYGLARRRGASIRRRLHPASPAARRRPRSRRTLDLNESR
jgi:hypothetical protein